MTTGHEERVARHTAWLEAEGLKIALEQAERTRSQLLAAIRVLSDGFVIYDRNDRLVLCNERYKEFYPLTAPVMQTGARFEDILRYGISVGEYAIPPGEEEAWLAERLDVHRQAETMLEQPLSDGRWLRIVERAMPDGGRVGLRIDITAQKRAAERLAAIIRGTNAGTWELNIQTGEAIFNDRYAEMIGETVESLGPQRFETF
ncbi:MAG: PAS-domain containing protein, partial [Pseudomonadota bacterium]